MGRVGEREGEGKGRGGIEGRKEGKGDEGIYEEREIGRKMRNAEGGGIRRKGKMKRCQEGGRGGKKSSTTSFLLLSPLTVSIQTITVRDKMWYITSPLN
jgi:hypothetical protein